MRELERIFGSFTKAFEIFLLEQDVKPVVRQGYYQQEIGEVQKYCEFNSLAWELSPYKIILTDDTNYSNKGEKVPLSDKREGMFFIYISKDDNKAKLASHYESTKDHVNLGLILGYPMCCANFFQHNEPVRSKLDNNYIEPALKNSKGNSFPYQTNILKRDQDATLLFHFPCNFNCQDSITLAKKHEQALQKYDKELATQLASTLKGTIDQLNFT